MYKKDDSRWKQNKTERAHFETSAWTAICQFLDELNFTLLRLWASEFEIPNWYAGFKIALDTALETK